VVAEGVPSPSILQPVVVFLAQLPTTGLTQAQQADVVERLEDSLLDLPDEAEVDIALALVPAASEFPEDTLSLEVSIDLKAVSNPAVVVNRLMQALLFDFQSMLNETFVDTYGVPSIRRLQVQESNAGMEELPDTDESSPSPAAEARLSVLMNLMFDWGSEMINSTQLAAIEDIVGTVVGELLSELHSSVGSASFPAAAEIMVTGAELRPDNLSVSVAVSFPQEAEATQRVAEELAEALWDDAADLRVLVAQAAADQPEIRDAFLGLAAEPTVARIPPSSSLTAGSGVLPSGSQDFTAFVQQQPADGVAGETKPLPASSAEALKKEVDAVVSFSLVFPELDLAQLQPSSSLEAFRQDVASAMSDITGEPRAATVLDSIMAGSVVVTGSTAVPASLTAVDSASKLFLHLLSQEHGSGGVLGSDVLAAWGSVQVAFVSIDTESSLGGGVAGRADAVDGQNFVPQGDAVLEPAVDAAAESQQQPVLGKQSTQTASTVGGYTVPWWVALLATVAVVLAVVLAAFALYTARVTRRKQKKSMRAAPLEPAGGPGSGLPLVRRPPQQAGNRYVDGLPGETTYGWQQPPPSRPHSRGGGGGGVVLVSNPTFNPSRQIDIEAARSLATTAASTPHSTKWTTEYVSSTTPGGVPGLGSIALPRHMLPPGKPDRWPHSSSQASGVWGSPGSDHHPAHSRLQAAPVPENVRPQRLLPTKPAGYSSQGSPNEASGPSVSFLPDPFLVNASEPPVPRPPPARKVPRYTSAPASRIPQRHDIEDTCGDVVPLRFKYGQQSQPQ